MSTLKQIEANRRNAQKSTGPNTPEGKASARLNALKHGMYANSPVIKGEDPALYDALAQSYFDRFNPATPEEHTLLAGIIRNAWELDRLARIETDLFNRELEDMDEDETHPLGRLPALLGNRLSRLQRLIDSADRAFRRNLEFLLDLQARRAQAQSAQPDPPPNGFVPAESPVPPARPLQTGLPTPQPLGASPATPRASIGDSQLP
jgi:hypothetical protein